MRESHKYDKEDNVYAIHYYLYVSLSLSLVLPLTNTHLYTQTNTHQFARLDKQIIFC